MRKASFKKPVDNYRTLVKHDKLSVEVADGRCRVDAGLKSLVPPQIAVIAT
jgi:hypothetical protein